MSAVPTAVRRWRDRALPPLPTLDGRARAVLAVVVAAGLRVVWALEAQEPQNQREPALTCSSASSWPRATATPTQGPAAA